MKCLMKYLMLICAALFSFSAMAETDLPFTILEQDKTIINDIRAEDDNIWIRLTTGHLNDEIKVRISDGNKDFYRSWFTGETDLVSTGFRGNHVWSDRVQTSAKYIEYWLDGSLILHLERH